MDFGDFAKLLLRRWYVAGPMLLVTLVATVFVGLKVSPEYVLTAYVQLVPPTSDAQTGQGVVNNGAPRNPWTILGLPALSQSATLATQDQTFLDKLTREGNSSKVDIEQSYPNPVITITVTGDTRAQVERSTDLITARYAQVTVNLQSQYKVAPTDMISTRRLDQGENVKKASGKVKRALIVVFAGGLLLTVGATVAVDAIARRRRRRLDGPAPTGRALQGKQPVAARRNGYLPGSDHAMTETLPVTRSGSGGSGGSGGRVRTMPGAKNQVPGAEYRSRSARSELAAEDPGPSSTGSPSTVDGDAQGRDKGRDKALPPLGSDATIVLAMPKRSPDENGGKRR